MMFNTIAPFVEKDSYIQVSGEEGDSWRWVFNGTTCEEVLSSVVIPIESRCQNDG